jgi:hypothetical protein
LAVTPWGATACAVRRSAVLVDPRRVLPEIRRIRTISTTPLSLLRCVARLPTYQRCRGLLCRRHFWHSLWTLVPRQSGMRPRHVLSRATTVTSSVTRSVAHQFYVRQPGHSGRRFILAAVGGQRLAAVAILGIAVLAACGREPAQRLDLRGSQRARQRCVPSRVSRGVDFVHEGGVRALLEGTPQLARSGRRRGGCMARHDDETDKLGPTASPSSRSSRDLPTRDLCPRKVSSSYSIEADRCDDPFEVALAAREWLEGI